MQYRHLLSIAFLFLALDTADLSDDNVDRSQGRQFQFTFHQPVTDFLQRARKQPEITDTAALKKSNWYAEVLQGIEDREYEIGYDNAAKSYASPNRKNNLRSFYTADKFTLLPRNDSADKWKLELTTLGVYVNNKWVYGPSVQSNVVLDQKTIRFNQDDNFITEYINSKEGVRQNFIIRKEPSATLNPGSGIRHPQTINLKLQTNKGWYVNKVHNKEIHFAKATKTGYDKKITYNDLKVWDAGNKELAASFSVKENVISITVNTAGAVYPITIDPISTTPAAMVESNTAFAWLGNSVASAGDVNGDGYSDIIVGAPQFTNVQSEEGAFFVYHGSASGISTTAAAIVESNQASAYMAESLASAGDVNADGYSDIVVGSTLYDNGQADEGVAFVYYGSASGIVLSPVILEPNLPGIMFGSSVASAGDVNGDGYSDVAVGARWYSNGQVQEGAIYIFHGSATGVNTSPANLIESNVVTAQLGASVASAGDVNGDGYSDLIAGADYFTNGQTNEGAFFVYHGSAAGIVLVAVTSGESDQVSAFMGLSVAGAGDVNGDGYSDVIVGAWGYDNGQSNEGRFYVYHGSPAGVNATAAAIVESNLANTALGYSVASAGDVNGDGYGDVIVGANIYSNGQINEGAAFVYLGNTTGISTTAAAVFETNQADATVTSVASAGDVNGDGYSDMIVGARLYNNGQTDEGAAFVYHGSASGISVSNPVTVENNQIGAGMGRSVSSAGDVNGDGYDDVIVGSIYYSNGETNEGAAFIYHGSATGISTTPAAVLESNQASAYFGYSVANAGDVNGDGYSDVIVSAPYYDNGETDEGAALIYHGSASGVSTTAAAIVESNQAGANMGWSVSGAGDVNGDGYSDVIAGAHNYSNGQASEGAFFVYHGSSAGINTTPAAIAESNLANALLGKAVGGAGDVNGDGYADVIAGAQGYANGQINEGAAFVYHGSAGGIITTPAVILESNQAGAYMGASVAGAGDVNGDGYSDVITGAFNYSNGEANEGAGYVFHGSATGISTTPAIILESNQASATMGASVASAGDVNGDGYSDVIVGAYQFDNGQTDEGAVFIFHGSSSGISGTIAAVSESNQTNGYMGISVASAGDVNGDGFSDVIVGVLGYTNGQVNEGAAFIYRGNNGGGLRNNLRLYNTDLVTPIQASNNSNPNLFGAGLFAKSPLGRVKGKLVWEVKPQGQPFSGNPITTSTAYYDKQTSFTNLGIAGTELKNNVQKRGKQTKIRARVEYDKVTAITGQVYGPWRYPPGYTMGAFGMNAIPLPVTLISFTGQFMNADDVQLSWITTNEVNMQSYIIERSDDGTSFTDAGTMAAKGQGSSRADYAFIDKNVLANPVYYRLRVVDKNGDIAFSKTITLGKPVTSKAYLAPNPVRTGSDVMLVYRATTNQHKATVLVYNTQAQLLQQNNIVLKQGRNEIRIASAKLPAGQYFIKLMGDGFAEIVKLLVQ